MWLEPIFDQITRPTKAAYGTAVNPTTTKMRKANTLKEKRTLYSWTAQASSANRSPYSTRSHPPCPTTITTTLHSCRTTSQYCRRSTGATSTKKTKTTQLNPNKWTFKSTDPLTVAKSSLYVSILIIIAINRQNRDQSSPKLSLKCWRKCLMRFQRRRGRCLSSWWSRPRTCRGTRSRTWRVRCIG